MLIDLHMHESRYSKDSSLSLEEIVTIAKRQGLDGICITDHDSLGLKKVAEAYAKAVSFPIFVGVEYFSLQGDIVAFGIEDIPKTRISAQAFIDYVKSRGGICFSAHPFRDNNRGLKESLFQVKGLDGIEAFNASTALIDNLKALECCVNMGIQPLGVSDCHVRDKVGLYATCFPDEVLTLAEFIQSFKKGRCSPVKYVNGAYVDLLPAVKTA